MKAACSGHTCYRLSLRRSGLFCRYANCLLQPWVGTPFCEKWDGNARTQAALGVRP